MVFEPQWKLRSQSDPHSGIIKTVDCVAWRVFNVLNKKCLFEWGMRATIGSKWIACTVVSTLIATTEINLNGFQFS